VLLESLFGDDLAFAYAMHARCRDVTARAVLTTVIGIGRGRATADAIRVRVGDRLMLGTDGQLACFGLEPRTAPRELLDDARQAVRTGTSTLCTYNRARDGILGLEVLHEVIEPSRSLLMCRAEVDATPLDSPRGLVGASP
jgi:hypothetical protein